MPEIKTCEEYVLKELENVQNQLATAEEANYNLTSEYNEIKTKYGFLINVLKDVSFIYDESNKLAKLYINNCDVLMANDIYKFLEELQ